MRALHLATFIYDQAGSVYEGTIYILLVRISV